MGLGAVGPGAACTRRDLISRHLSEALGRGKGARPEWTSERREGRGEHNTSLQKSVTTVTASKTSGPVLTTSSSHREEFLRVFKECQLGLCLDLPGALSGCWIAVPIL